jgi:hypothetical protein
MLRRGDGFKCAQGVVIEHGAFEALLKVARCGQGLAHND